MRDSKFKEFHLPADHQPGMRVPRGGSNCVKCRYLDPLDPGRCTNEYFIAWNGSSTIPFRIDSYCSDWFEPRKRNARNS